MKKNVLLSAAIAAALPFAFTSCSSSNDDENKVITDEIRQEPMLLGAVSVADILSS